LALMPAPLLAAVISPFAGRYADRVGHRWILAVGSAACAAGFLLQLLLLDETPATWSVYVPTSMLVGFGVGATIATWSSAGLADVSPDQFGTANATVRTTQQVFYALGISVIVAILANVSIDPNLEQFQWAWSFIGITYLLSAVTVAATFPAGSSDDRAVVAVAR
jgi:MFS family permease